MNAPPAGVDVGLIGRANASQEDNRNAARAVRSMFGISSVSGSDDASTLSNLQRIVSAGQIISGATATTERAVIVDSKTAADIAYQVERILQAPPLTLLVNPNQFSVTYGTVQQYSNRTRNGFIFERWGESQAVVSFGGSTGAFISGANPVASNPAATSTSTPTGVQYISKRDSAAYQNFISLFQFYRNNGYIYDTINGSEAHLMVGAVAIDYDQFTYVGNIDSFEYSYSDQSPHRIEWSMEFTAGQIFDSAQAPVLVQPMVSPTPNPAYPNSRARSNVSRPGGVSGGQVIQVSGGDQEASVPLDMLIPSQLR